MLPTPSSLGRIAACVRSETLERVEEVSEAATLGTQVHAFLCDVLTLGYEDALLKQPVEDRDWLRGFDPDRRLPAFQPEAFAPEIAFAYHPGTGACRELGRRMTRAAAHAMARPGEMVGLVDVAGVAPGCVVVHDYKSGWGWVDPASINWQVRTYALMAARAWGMDEAFAGILRARADGYVHFDVAHMDLFELEQHEVELRRVLVARDLALRAAADGEELPSFVEGPHCQYCPGRRICPPKTAQLLALADALPPLMGEDGKPLEMSRLADRLTHDTAPLVWERLKFAEKMIERLKAEVKEYARREPIPLGGGWVLGERSKATETVVADRAAHILEVTFGAELGRVVASEATEVIRKMTKEALGGALSRYVLPTLPKKEAKLKPVKEAVLQRFREGGAISVRSSRNVEEHKVKDPSEQKPLEGEPDQAA